ncbi:hypothetical protein KKI24_15560, partial [bacterium]|nr:hypothetical protein [bacterium]
DIYAHVPIGKIIALHPYATDPDSYFFKFCDGTGTLGDNFPGHETDPIPNLTDDRFLMGGSGYGTGGSNTLLDHTHGCGTESADHSHSTSIGSATSGGRSASHTHDTQYAGTHSHALHYIADGAWGVSTASVGYNGTILNTNSPQMTTTGSDGSHYHSGFAEATDHTHSVDFGNKQSGGVSASHNHVIGSGSAPTSTSNLPQYFKVKYYLKTN